MMTLSLDQEQQETFLQVMQHALETLELEVRHADSHDYKEMLKHRRGVIQDILAKVEKSGPVMA